MQAIQSGTGLAADCMGLAHEIGTLSKGKRADFVVVDGDPLRDIKVLLDPQRIKLVVKDGVVQIRR